MPYTRPLQILRHARTLITLGTPFQIVTAACGELMAATGSSRVFVGSCRPNQSWDESIVIEADATGTRPASPPARSALFALHRRLTRTREPIALVHGEDTAAMFFGLQADTTTTIRAVPIVHRTGRLWGELVVLSHPQAPDDSELLVALAQLTTVALENAQRLAFARRDQDRLLLIAEAGSDALYDWNWDTHDFWWGGGIVKLLGSGSEAVETTSTWMHDRIHPDDRACVLSSFESARASRAATWACDFRFRCADGSYCDVEDRGYFLRETNGRAYRMIGSLRDVTAMKQSLMREQAARREAEAASRAKDQFLAMLGHELRNPLAPIISGLQLLQARGSTERRKELTVIERQAQHLVRLVDDLLDISRIAHGKIELKRQRCDLASVISTAIDTIQPLIDSRRHSLSVDIADGAMEVDGDRARLGQAISNLLSNAAKYTEPGGRISLRGWRDGEVAVITVRDTGIGISPEMLPNVFEMFVQEGQALDRAQGGLGLGLAIVRSMVELHGGAVTARSDGPGTGSEFTIRLPLAAASPDHAVREVAREIRRSGNLRILVVDDNIDAAELLSMALDRRGNTTRVAHDATAALQVVDEFSPDLAVLDIGLPFIDGYEFARRLREHPATRTTRLIALTGYGQASDKQRSAEAGFDAHLVKPIAVEALEAVIESLAG